MQAILEPKKGGATRLHLEFSVTVGRPHQVAQQAGVQQLDEVEEQPEEPESSPEPSPGQLGADTGAAGLGGRPGYNPSAAAGDPILNVQEEAKGAEDRNEPSGEDSEPEEDEQLYLQNEEKIAKLREELKDRDDELARIRQQADAEIDELKATQKRLEQELEAMGGDENNELSGDVDK